jgi:hypothetical protein
VVSTRSGSSFLILLMMIDDDEERAAELDKEALWMIWGEDPIHPSTTAYDKQVENLLNKLSDPEVKTPRPPQRGLVSPLQRSHTEHPEGVCTDVFLSRKPGLLLLTIIKFDNI